jgi:hypothetical protein
MATCPLRDKVAGLPSCFPAVEQMPSRGLGGAAFRHVCAVRGGVVEGQTGGAAWRYE